MSKADWARTCRLVQGRLRSARRGMLTSGRYSTLTWSRAGAQTGSITLTAQHDGVRLIYQIKDRDGLPVKVDVPSILDNKDTYTSEFRIVPFA